MMTVSQLIDLLRQHEGDQRVVFLAPNDGALKLDEVYDRAYDGACVIDFVLPDE